MESAVAASPPRSAITWQNSRATYWKMAVVASAVAHVDQNLARRLREEVRVTPHCATRFAMQSRNSLLAMAAQPIDHIAERLGYSEASSFIHAFNVGMARPR